MKQSSETCSSIMRNNVSPFEKYWMVIKISWIDAFSYPASFWIWRFRQITQIVVAFSLWEAIFVSNTHAFGYQKPEMLTYIFMSSIISSLIMSSRTIDVVSIINSGDLSLYLLKPLNFFTYWFSRDMADKLYNVIFALGEMTLLFFIFRPPFAFPHSLLIVALTLVSSIAGLIMYFFINMMFGFLGFWSPDSWAPRFLFMTIMTFTAGSLYPLDIFPASIVRFLLYTPFPYLMYFQTKIWLGHVPAPALLQGFLMMGVWTLVLGILAKLMWKKGLRTYSSQGH